MEERSQQMIQEVGQVIMGKQDVVEKIWRTILAGGHVLLNDVPGTGLQPGAGAGVPARAVYARCGALGHHRIYRAGPGDGKVYLPAGGCDV